MEIITTGNFFENTYIINNDNKAIIVDPGEDLIKYKDILDKYNIVAVLITHAHIDHIDGISLFKNLPIYLYKDEYEVFKDNNKNLYNLYNKELPFDISKLDIRLLNDNSCFELIGLNIKVILTKGHTIGSVSYLINSKILFSGDALFNGSIGRTDFPTGNQKDYIKTLDIFKSLDDSIEVYPGHGPSTTIGFEKKYNPFFN